MKYDIEGSFVSFRRKDLWTIVFITQIHRTLGNFKNLRLTLMMTED